MLVIGLLVSALARPLAAAYTTDLEVVLFVASLLPLSAAAMAPDGGQAVASAALRAHGDNWFPTASHVLAYAVLMPALGLGLAELKGMGVSGLLQAIIWSSVFSVSVLMGRLWILTRRIAPRLQDSRT
jgi:MATE family multidrug resistance protein